MSSAIVIQKKRGRGRKSLWETDYDAAVKRQWGRVMKEIPKLPMSKLRKVPMRCEVVALLTQHGEVVSKFAATIGEVKVVSRRGGRKSLWETDPEAAAARELERQLLKVPAQKSKKIAKKALRGLWATDYDAAVKRQWVRVMKELPKAPKEGKLKAGVAEKVLGRKGNKEGREIAKMKKEMMAMKAELDALKMPKKHSV